MSEETTTPPKEEAPKEEAAAAEGAAPEPPAPEDASAAMKVFIETKVDGGKKSVWQMTLETFGMADGGKQAKDDVLVESSEEALTSLQSMVATVKDDHPKWQFTLTPLDEFEATIDDVLKAFIKWAQKDDDKDNKSINVSKAFRRLDAYVQWMEDHRTELEAPLTVDSVRAAAHAWQVKLTHDASDRLVWWIDMGAMDTDVLKKGGAVSPTDSLRFIVWQSHYIMFDSKAQDNGIIVVEAMGSQGMIATMTLVPMEIGTKLDRLTIGVLPIKMKACYIFNYRKWLAILLGIMKPFMSKKMRQRIITIPEKDDPQKVMEEALGGKENIPMGFANLEGTMEDDIVFGKYIK